MGSTSTRGQASTGPGDPRRGGQARLAAALAALRGPARAAADNPATPDDPLTADNPLTGDGPAPANSPAAASGHTRNDVPARDRSASARSAGAESLMRSLAGDLHDGAVQELFAASLDLVELVEMADVPDEASAVIERLGRRIDDAARQLRGVMQDMSRGQRESAAEPPLIEAMQERIEVFSAGSDINVDVEVRGRGPEPGPGSREALLRFVREGLVNVGKHSLASQAIVTVHRGRQWWKVDVDDDGLGDARTVRIAMSRSAGDDYGLSSLAEQARASGGRMWVSAAPRLEGLRVSLTVPIGPGQTPPNGGQTSPAPGVVAPARFAHTGAQSSVDSAYRTLAG